MNQVAIIGAGIIGSSWALVFARKGIKVALYEQSQEQRARVQPLLRDMILHSQSLLPSNESADTILARIRAAATLADAVEGAGYVQEAIIESIPAKQALFAELDRLCPPHVILATSSSTYGVSRFADDLEHRARCIVSHPMTPPHLMPIIEVVPAPFTHDDVVQQTMAFMRTLGQVPVLIKKETESFVLNRLQGALLLEMFKVLDEGLISVPDVDDIIRHGLGLRWAALGPLQGIDLNAPQGIGDYLERYGHIFNDMGQTRGYGTAVDEELIRVLQAEMRRQLPLGSLDKRRAWRDQAISGIRSTLNTLPEEHA